MKDQSALAHNNSRIVNMHSRLSEQERQQRTKELKHAVLTISQALVEHLESGKELQELNEMLSVFKMVIDELQALHRSR